MYKITIEDPFLLTDVSESGTVSPVMQTQRDRQRVILVSGKKVTHFLFFIYASVTDKVISLNF